MRTREQLTEDWRYIRTTLDLSPEECAEVVGWMNEDPEGWREFLPYFRGVLERERQPWIDAAKRLNEKLENHHTREIA